jgi:hypothetical protein
MPYVPQGKKAKRRAAALQRERERDQLIDLAVSGVRFATQGPRLCLQMSVLLENLLGEVLPKDLFKVRLGSLHVFPTREDQDPITFDPRSPDGVDGGFHAWVEDRRGELVDPSIAPTLAAEGYAVDPADLIQCAGRSFTAFDLRFHYEPLDELELLNLDKSAHWIASMRELATMGGFRAPPSILLCPLDIRFRPTVES